jgi:hypothetical protein
MGFLAPHLKQILKKSLLCWAICFLVASVIGIQETLKRRADFKFSLVLLCQLGKRVLDLLGIVSPKSCSAVTAVTLQ